jgi:Lipocalin-like domain
MKQIAQIILAIALLFPACNNDEQMTKLIVGEWHGVSWTTDGKPVIPDASSLTLVVSSNGVYNLIGEGRVENGDWKVKNDSLFLSPEASEDVKMKIISLSDSKLELQVFRGQIDNIEFKR